MEDGGMSNSDGSMGNSNGSVGNDGTVGNNRSVGNSNRSMGNHRAVGNNRGMGNNRVGNLDWSRSVGGDSLIGDLSNISTVGISSVVVDNLGSAIRKSNSVGSRGGVSISILLLIKVSSAVVISYSILVSIDRGVIIDGLGSVSLREGSSQEGGENNSSL